MDVAPLLERLRGTPGYSRARLAGPPEALGGGFWAETFVLRFEDVEGVPAELVVRVMPDEDAAARETVVHRCVVAQRYPAPTIRVSGSRDLGLGGPFILMDRVSGSPLLHDLSGPKAVPALPRVFRRLPGVLAEAMATLHALDVGPVHDAFRAAGLRAATEVDDVYAHLGDAAGRTDDAEVRGAATWLDRHRPTASRTVVCHGDLHPFNVLVEGRRWSVIDWTGAVLGEPEYDVAFTRFLVGHPPLHVPPPLRPALALTGRRLGRRFERAYARRSGIVVRTEALEWYTVLHALRIALDLDAWRRAGSLGSRAGHPWCALEPTVRDVLRRHARGNGRLAS